MNSKITELIDATADSVLSSDLPVLIDFWAEWCAPCRMLSVTMDAIADTHSDRVKVVKADVENGAMETAKKFGVSALPTIIFVKNGKMVKKMVGLSSKQEILNEIDKI